MQQNRDDKLKSVEKLVLRENEHLKKHPKASIKTAIKHVSEKIKKLKLNKWVKCDAKERKIALICDNAVLAKESSLDDCYVIKTDIPGNILGSTSQNIHDRYKDLSEVEFAFRTMKTIHLELRPHYVRKACRHYLCSS